MDNRTLHRSTVVGQTLLTLTTPMGLLLDVAGHGEKTGLDYTLEDHIYIIEILLMMKNEGEGGGYITVLIETLFNLTEKKQSL